MALDEIPIQDQPAYTIGAAAGYLGLPASTVRAWVKGQHYRADGESRKYVPLITPADPINGMLSFRNLVELHVLSVIRRFHGIPMGRMRTAIDYMKNVFGTEHPLADIPVETDGAEVLVEQLEDLVSASGAGQTMIRGVVEQYLQRIDRDADGNIWLYPFTRSSDHAEQPKLVKMDPRIAFGRPVVAGTGVPTAMLGERYRAGESIQQLADDYGLDQLLIEEAIRCEMKAA